MISPLSCPRLGLAVVLLVAGAPGLVSVGCGDDERSSTYWPEAGGRQTDGRIFVDGRAADLGAAPDGLPNDKGGPKITIDTPAEDATVVATSLKVKATISDSDGVDDQTVKLYVQGQSQAAKMGITAKQDVYEGLIDISKFTDKVRIWIIAADLLGNKNSAVRTFRRDPGPVVRFLSPAKNSRHASSVSVQVAVADTVSITSFGVKLGNYALTLSKTAAGKSRTVYAGTVKFNDTRFGGRLSGKQVLTATAVNKNSAKTISQRTFYVDDTGPTIKIISQDPGELIGGVINLAADVTDEAGVVASTVKCVIGNSVSSRTVQLLRDSSNSKRFTGQFDTNNLADTDLWPVLSFRAADKLGNEATQDILVGVDNGPPIVELDPPKTFHLGHYKSSLLQCSQAFDPVGSAAANDLEKVPQITVLRARIEDQGNHVPSARWVPVALVDDSEVRLYVLDDTSKALLVDSTGDGYCDRINTNVVPLGSKPQPGEAVRVQMTEISPSGNADYRPSPPLPSYLSGRCSAGDATTAPSLLCDRRYTNMTVAISDSADAKQGAIFTLPPTSSTGSCVGLPFDFRANQFKQGWVCAAVEARDKLGNRGVSPPLRLYYDPTILKRTSGPSGAPDCTGTLDKSSGKVNTSKPCKFRSGSKIKFPQRFPSQEIVIE